MNEQLLNQIENGKRISRYEIHILQWYETETNLIIVLFQQFIC